MAKKDTKPRTTPGTNVRRISARDDTEKKPTGAQEQVQPVASPADASDNTGPTTRRSPLRAMSDYFKGAWYELRQVRWPTRKATWGMTAALLVFTTFFVLLILLLDAVFKYVFQVILG